MKLLTVIVFTLLPSYAFAQTPEVPPPDALQVAYDACVRQQIPNDPTLPPKPPGYKYVGEAATLCPQVEADLKARNSKQKITRDAEDLAAIKAAKGKK